MYSPQVVVCLITSLVLTPWFTGCTAGGPSQVCRVSPLRSSSLTATFLTDVNHPKSIQEDLVSNWEPAHSLVEDAISAAEIAPRLLVLSVADLPLCLQQGEELV